MLPFESKFLLGFLLLFCAFTVVLYWPMLHLWLVVFYSYWLIDKAAFCERTLLFYLTHNLSTYLSLYVSMHPISGIKQVDTGFGAAFLKHQGTVPDFGKSQMIPAEPSRSAPGQRLPLTPRCVLPESKQSVGCTAWQLRWPEDLVLRHRAKTIWK